MHMNISYINMCKLKKNRMKKGIREGEREVGGDGVCGCSFGEPLKQETWVHSRCFCGIRFVLLFICFSVVLSLSFVL